MNSSPSYLEESWAVFRQQRQALAALIVVGLVILVAMLCPLLANNRPLYLYAPMQSDYRDALAIGAEQVRLGTAEGDRRAGQALQQVEAHLRFAEDGNARATFAAAVATFGKGARDAAEREAVAAGLEALFDVMPGPVRRFPAWRALATFEVVLLLVLPLSIVGWLLRRRWSGTMILGAVLLAALLAGLLIRTILPPVKDARSYRRILTTEAFQQQGFALLAPIPYGENENIIADARQAPTWMIAAADRTSPRWHWLGTDTNGRDVLTRMIYGARVSIFIGVVAVSLYTLIGIVLGALAGYYGGWADLLISRLIEFVICFPVLMVILSVQAYLAPSLLNLVVALALMWWTGVARLQRAEFLRLVNLDFVQSVRALGGSDVRIIALHMLPNGLAPILVMISFGVAGSIVVESALSYLGFGVPQPMASWGDLLNNGRNDVRGLWWLTIFPGLAIFVTVTCFNLVGEAVRDALDPKRTL